LGTIQFYHDWNFPAAEETFRNALSIDPSNAFVRQRFSMLLAARGRLREAIEVGSEAARLEPGLAIRLSALSTLRYYARDYDAAEADARRALAIVPNDGPAFHILGLIAAARGRYDEAIADVRRALAQSNYAVWQISLARMYAAAGRTEEEQQLLAALRERERGGETFGIDHFAYIAIVEGRSDEAFQILNQAVDQRTPNVLWILVDPRVDRVRTDPRYEQLIARTGLRP
jgi:tetratricopeptide (TPR) repeat protein